MKKVLYWHSLLPVCVQYIKCYDEKKKNTSFHFTARKNFCHDLKIVRLLRFL